MPRTARNKNYRQGFREIFEYFEQLPGSQKVRQGKEWDAKIVRPPYNTLKAYMLGKRPSPGTDAATSKPVLELVQVLIQRKLLSPELAEPFARDLSDGLSILHYLPPSNEIPGPQPAVFLNNLGDIDALQRHFPESFVGYEQPQMLIQDHLERGRRVIVHGQPGAGKTTLAAQIVQSYLAEQTSASQHKRVVWMETGYGAVAQVEGEIVVALHKSGSFDVALKDANVGLIVLDNVWNKEIPAWIDTIPRAIKVLVTSREPWRVERRELVRLDGLQGEASLKLLGQSAGINYSDDAEAETLCAKLGNLPLALKIAGSLLAETQQTPGTISQNLSQITYDQIEREIPYAALIEQNFRSPSIEPKQVENVRIAFRAFGALFNRQIPRALLEIYQTCLGKNQGELVLSVENHLNRQSITQSDGIFLYVNDVIFALSHEICSDEDRLQGLEACWRYLNHHVLQENSSGFEALWVARENLLGALRYAWSIEQQASESRFFDDALWLLASKGYFDAKGYTREWIQYLEWAAQRAEAQHDLNRAHYLWAKIGNGYALFEGRYERESKLSDALKAYMKALEFAPGVTREDAIVREAVSLSLIGVTFTRLGNIGQAEQYFQRALSRGSGYPVVLSQIYEHMGRYAAERKGDLNESRTFFLESLRQAERIEGDIEKWYYRRFHAYTNLAEVEMRALNEKSALEYVELAWDCADKTNKDDLRARAACERGEKLLAFGEPEEAYKWLERAVGIYQRIDDEENTEHVRKLKQQAESVLHERKG